MAENDPYYPSPGEPGAENIQNVRHNQLSARVPQHVARGVFSTGALVITGGNEFVLDFVLRMMRPHQIVARVVLPHVVMPQLIRAIEDNIDRFTERFGEPTELPKPPADAPRPAAQDIYDELKIADEMLSGAYANAVMLSHSAAEFNFDFITSFYPNSAVSARVFMSAPHVPQLLDSLKGTWSQLQRRRDQIEQAKRAANDKPNEPADEPKIDPIEGGNAADELDGDETDEG